MGRVKVAALQTGFSWDLDNNLVLAEELVRQAASLGAQIVLLQEFVGLPYFCQEERASYFALASTIEQSPVIQRLRPLAAELGVVLPISFFEAANNVHFNSVAIVDADGSTLGIYRKSHIPDGPGYEEKFYFSPGDTGFRTWKTRYAHIGVGICWDQWFPECARIMALRGAEILFFPTAIGSEPSDPTLVTTGHWQRAMQGHSAANMVPVVAANRVGSEETESSSVQFYGHSFITDHTGYIVEAAGGDDTAVVVAELDLDQAAAARKAFGLFRDRRPELYRPLLTFDGD